MKSRTLSWIASIWKITSLLKDYLSSHCTCFRWEWVFCLKIKQRRKDSEQQSRSRSDFCIWICCRHTIYKRILVMISRRMYYFSRRWMWIGRRLNESRGVKMRLTCSNWGILNCRERWKCSWWRDTWLTTSKSNKAYPNCTKNLPWQKKTMIDWWLWYRGG